MLPRKRRIPRLLFKDVLESRTYFNSPHLSLRVAKTSEPARVSVSVSKKISKSAVVRNKVRRRIYSALTGSLSAIPSGLYFVITKPGSEKLKGEALKSELHTLFSKAGAIVS